MQIRKRIKKAIVVFSILFSLTSLARADDILSTSLRLQNITVKKGMVSTIKFSSTINYFLVGDDKMVEVNQITANTLYVSPQIAGSTTNINVSTMEGNYVFVMKIIDYKNVEQPNLHINVGLDAIKTGEEKLNKKILKQNPKNNPQFDYNFSMSARLFCNWWLCHDKDIAPQRIWTDGKYTYLDYNNNKGVDQNISVVSEVIDDIDTPINSTIKEGILIVHTLSKKLIIKASKKYVCIEYRGDKYVLK